MSQLCSLPLQFRHVVFPAEVRRRRRVVNLAAEVEGASAADSAPPVEDDASNFVQWLFSLAGLDARKYRPDMLQRRLPACLRALHADSPAHARQLIEAAPALAAVGLGAMLVGITSFFRDPPVFDALQRHVLPELARGRRGLNVWSIGCSEGAELYSVAILLAEMGLLPGSYLLGTDCRTAALHKARAGWFDSAAVKNVPPALRARWFQPHGSGWQILPLLRLALRWRTADVLHMQEPGIWDVICFRNTAMYLRPAAVAPLWERLELALRPGGVLVLGKAERPGRTRRLTLLGPCIYRRSRG